MASCRRRARRRASARSTTPRRARRGPRRPGGARGAFGILFSPVALLILLFLVPLLIMVQMSVVRFPPNIDSGYTLDHYVEVLTNPLNLHIAWTTFMIATTAMVVMLADRDAARLLHGVQGQASGSCSSCSRSCWPTSSRRS